MSAGLPVPRQVFGHGWWLRDEAKMSKSIGNVVRPDHLMDRFGADPLRYFLAREMAFGQDSSFSDEAFLERFNADLANALGNTASRTLAMVGRYLSARVPAPSGDGPIPAVAAEAVTTYRRRMDEMEPHRALEATWQLLAAINGFIQERQPWALAKGGESDRANLEATLYAALEGLRITSVLIEPVMPTVAERLRAQLGAQEQPADLETSSRWGLLSGAVAGGPSEPLFPRVDVAAFLKETDVEQTATPEDERLIDIDRFAETRLVVGVVREAERVPKSKKLMRIMVDLGEPQPRQVVAGIADQYDAQDLIGRRIVVVANLKPATLMGVESRGMLLAASVDGEPFLLSVDGDVPAGSAVK
jgi:methionyl-tRNA synthetase